MGVAHLIGLEASVTRLVKPTPARLRKNNKPVRVCPGQKVKRLFERTAVAACQIDSYADVASIHQGKNLVGPCCNIQCFCAGEIITVCDVCMEIDQLEGSFLHPGYRGVQHAFRFERCKRKRIGFQMLRFRLVKSSSVCKGAREVRP